MGLVISHDAFEGAYSAFNRLRQFILLGTGGSYPPHKDDSLDSERWYFGNGFTNDSNPALYEFMCHSDCDGEIIPEVARKLAAELEELLPELEKIAEGLEAAGHIQGQGGYLKVTQRLIKGCKRAFELNEPLEFY